MLDLKAKQRLEAGKKVKILRRAGFLPAVLYGEGIASQAVSVDYRDFEKVYREAGESSVIKLDLEGRVYDVLIHDLAFDPLKGNPVHADFYAVKMDKSIRTKVSLEFTGESPAVKNEGGVFVKVIKEIEIEALPGDLPHSLSVDVSGLVALESKLLVRDLNIPKGVKILADPEEVVILVETPRSEEELTTLKESKAEAAPVEVKTEREVKQAMKEKAKEEKETVE